jgi:hypothetical protein
MDRVYELIRQPARSSNTIEIAFRAPGVQAYAFTCA